MMSGHTTTLPPTQLNNRADAVDAASLLSAWLEEDLAALKSQRTELDTRIARAEQRLQMLRERQGAGNPHRTISTSDPQPTTSTRTDAAPTSAPTTPTYDGPRRSIMSLGLENRTYNALVKHGITSFAQLVNTPRGELRNLQGFGAGSLADLEAALARVDITLPDNGAKSPTPAAPAVAPRIEARVESRVEPRAESRTESLPWMNGYSNKVATPAVTPHAETDTDEAEAEAEPSTGETPSYEDATALHHKFGVLRLEDIRDTLGITDIAALDLLKADTRWTAHGGGWYVRTPVEQSWIARRVIEILSAVKSIAIEPLYQAVKRIAANKFLEQGCHMPTRSLLAKMVQELVVEGVRFDIIKEIASMPAPTGELSGSTRAILNAFGTGHRAITNAEILPHFLEVGMTEGSANVAISTSPLITKLERGIYGLVGRHADMRDIASARLRREAGKIIDAPADP
ncbi:MAG: DNA-directed RNA polymerase subunit alpha C-terminal domain-containing protein [Gemmatimonas sp.]